MSKEQIEAQLFQDTFINVMALYCVLKAAPQPGPRRAVLNQSGEVTAESIDFISDVEIKAKRTLTPVYYKVFLQLSAENAYELFPVDMQCALGQAFLKSRMNFDGDYRVLYYRAKNNQLQDRPEPQPFPEEAINPEDILE